MQQQEQTVTNLPKRIPTPRGEVILASERDATMYELFKFAAARRVDDVLYLSGVIAGPERGETRDTEGFKAQLRRAFGQIGATLKAAGADFERVAMINTFHVWK